MSHEETEPESIRALMARAYRANAPARAEQEQARRDWERDRAKWRAKWLGERRKTPGGSAWLSDDARALLSSGAIERTPAIEHAAKWLTGDLPVLILGGGVGSGKTLAAAWALAEFFEPSFVRCVDDLCARLDIMICPEPADERRAEGFARKCGVAMDARSLHKVIEPWREDVEAGWALWRPERPAIVALDDLGSERQTDRWDDALAVFVDARIASGGKRTIITTNLGRGDIRPRYGDRIADRLNHSSVFVELKGTSLRRQGAGL